MSEPVRVSFSRVKTRRRCHRAHHYKYIQGLQRKKPGIALFKGSIVHDMVEAHLIGKDWKKVLKKYEKEFNKLFKEEKEMHGDLPGNMRRIMEGYIEHWKKDKLVYTAVEEKFEFKLDKGIIAVFQIDAAVKDAKKRPWLLERKTPKSFPDEDVRMSDIQTVLYLWAWLSIGRKAQGILWDYVRSKPPTIPDQLKAGGLSIAKNIDTTYDVYLNEIKRLKLNPKDYTEKLDSLKGTDQKFYRRVYMPVSQGVMETIVEDFKTTAREIRDNPDSQVRTLSYDCRQCEFYNLCQAELRDLDTDFILKSQYERSDRVEIKDEKQQAEVED